MDDKFRASSMAHYDLSASALARRIDQIVAGTASRFEMLSADNAIDEIIVQKNAHIRLLNDRINELESDCKAALNGNKELKGYIDQIKSLKNSVKSSEDQLRALKSELREYWQPLVQRQNEELSVLEGRVKAGWLEPRSRSVVLPSPSEESVLCSSPDASDWTPCESYVAEAATWFLPETSDAEVRPAWQLTESTAISVHGIRRVLDVAEFKTVEFSGCLKADKRHSAGIWIGDSSLNVRSEVYLNLLYAEVSNQRLEEGYAIKAVQVAALFAGWLTFSIIAKVPPRTKVGFQLNVCESPATSPRYAGEAGCGISGWGLYVRGFES